MAEAEKSKLSVEKKLLAGLVVSILLSTTLIVLASSSKETVFSPYVRDADGAYQYQQLTKMRDSLGEDDGYEIYNTMSTPMLVNDWQDPHRTMLVITAPEKPFDAAEASAIYDFVTEKGGKVILAASSTNAQRVAEEFGILYFDAPILDQKWFYEVANSVGEREPEDQTRLWSVASVNQDLDEMDEASLRTPCTEELVSNSQVDNCRMPVLFHSPTAIQVLDVEDDSREVSVLASASDQAFVARSGYDINNVANPKTGKTDLMIRIDYPGIEAYDKTSDKDLGKVDVTGSIVFVSDHSVFANHLWDEADADLTGKQQCGSDLYSDNAHSCWDTDPDGLAAAQGDTKWNGNQLYFRALIRDMMEFDNEELSTTITRNQDEFNIVFDESRHVSSAITQPFTEAIGAVVLLTSDTYLKWLIILNLFALLAIAIMVVPEKENWRHVFDLTRFRERPTKIDSSLYQVRVREAFLSKVRQFNDLTRDEFVRKTPAEIMQMVREPRLVELVSSARSYSNEELREIIPIVRRWGN
ncbi:DUF4350 domain-containing protein [Candidatus Poseidoniales archaeon]|nr:DUF4350 domain-containing protein [Candidatus Poseidoniales archaeon]